MTNLDWHSTEPEETTLIKHPQADQMTFYKSKKYRAVQFMEFKRLVEEFGFLEIVWGMDIFYGKVPFLKTLLLVNILVWILFVK
jgi:hypothetical protein